jgi:hypothetical protein
MNCDGVQELLALAAGGDLTSPEAARLERHLHECAGCQQFHERLESNQSLLRSLRRDVVSPAAITQMRSGLFLQLENPHAVLGWRIRLERFLLTGFRRPRYAVAGAAVAAIMAFMLFPQRGGVAADPLTAAAVFEGEDMLLRPEYADWKVVDTTAHTEQHTFQKAYINPFAYGEFVRTGAFPEGTVMVLESTSSSASLLASVKDNKRFEGGWGYFEFQGGDTLSRAKTPALPESAGCVGCHRGRAATDQVFTQFYPVLRTAAGVL